MSGKEFRPRIKIAKTKIDYFLEITAFILILLLWIKVIGTYSALPEIVPKHYGFPGKPDAYGSKINIFLLPSVGTVLFILLYVLAYFPHAFNYPLKLTEKNVVTVYKSATRFIRVLNLYIVFAFYVISYKSLEVAQQRANALGVVTVPVLIIGVVVLIFSFVINLSKKKIVK